jgi:hypothetical protein
MNHNRNKGRCARFLVAFFRGIAAQKGGVKNSVETNASARPHASFLHGTGYPWQGARQQSLRPFRRMPTAYSSRRRRATCVAPASRHHHHTEDRK